MSTGGTILVELFEHFGKFEASLIKNERKFTKVENDITTDFKIEYTNQIELFEIGFDFGLSI